MKRISILTALPLVLVGCMAPPPETPAERAGAVSTLRPAPSPVPLDVLRALPAGVSTSSLQVDAANCWFYDDGTGPQAITTTTTSGQQPYCGLV